MPGDKTRDLRKVNRRSFLRKLSAMGVSAITLSYLSKDALAEVTHNPKEEVPYVAYLRGEPPERDPVYKTVEREEWERRHTAIDAGERIHRKLSELTDSDLIQVGYQADDSSPTDFSVLVSYKRRRSESQTLSPDISLENLKSKLPNSMTGEAGEGEYETSRKDIPVVVEDAETIEPEPNQSSNCMPNDKYWQETPGGTPVDIGFYDGILCAVLQLLGELLRSNNIGARG